MLDEDWEYLGLDLGAIMCSSLTHRVLYKVMNVSSVEELSNKLESLYTKKSLQNWLYLE